MAAPTRTFRLPPCRAGRLRAAREKDAGSARSSATCAPEDALSCRPVRSGGQGFIVQQPPGSGPPAASVHRLVWILWKTPMTQHLMGHRAARRVDSRTVAAAASARTRPARRRNRFSSPRPVLRPPPPVLDPRTRRPPSRPVGRPTGALRTPEGSARAAAAPRPQSCVAADYEARGRDAGLPTEGNSGPPHAGGKGDRGIEFPHYQQKKWCMRHSRFSVLHVFNSCGGTCGQRQPYPCKMTRFV